MKGTKYTHAANSKKHTTTGTKKKSQQENHMEKEATAEVDIRNKGEGKKRKHLNQEPQIQEEHELTRSELTSDPPFSLHLFQYTRFWSWCSLGRQMSREAW